MRGESVRRRVHVSGRVQGVWFRESCRREAELLGVNGWIRNREDGRVEAVFEGPAESVRALIDWCRVGPPHADVDRLDVTEEPPQGHAGFAVF
jgi:acylphosphatase